MLLLGVYAYINTSNIDDSDLRLDIVKDYCLSLKKDVFGYKLKLNLEKGDEISLYDFGKILLQGIDCRGFILYEVNNMLGYMLL